MLTWTYTGEVNAKRVREQYLKAILRQDIAYFDKVGLPRHTEFSSSDISFDQVGAGEVATRIQTDTREYGSHIVFSISEPPHLRLGPARHFRKGCARC